MWRVFTNAGSNLANDRKRIARGKHESTKYGCENVETRSCNRMHLLFSRKIEPRDLDEGEERKIQIAPSTKCKQAPEDDLIETFRAKLDKESVGERDRESDGISA